jgi:hypothetical protein
MLHIGRVQANIKGHFLFVDGYMSNPSLNVFDGTEESRYGTFGTPTLYGSF